MKSYLRFLKRNPAYTVINVIGLAVALMFVILIGDYTWRQFSMDTKHPDKDRIVLMSSNGSYFSWPDASKGIEEMCPEIESMCRVISHSGTIISQHNKVYDREHPVMMLADSTLFRFFDFKFLEGDASNALAKPEDCVITESLASVLFPEGDALGKPLQLHGTRYVRINDGSPDPYDTTLVYNVSGIIRDFDRTVLPNETQLIASLDRHPQILGYRMANSVFASSSVGCMMTFYMLEKGADLESRKEEINEYLDKNLIADFWSGSPNRKCNFTPLRKVMFAPENKGLGLEKGDKGLLTILLSSIFAILLFAVTNYINLTVANTGMRAKEMATRRLLGTSRNSITFKLIAESVLMVAVSFLIGLGLAFAFQDDIASMFMGKIVLENDLNAGTIGVCVAFIAVTGILAGLVPGMQISMYKPVDVVKGTFRYNSKMVFSRIFIMLQNIITVVMLTASLVIALQIRAMVKAPLGVNTEDIMIISSYNDDQATILSTLEQMPCVEKIGKYSGSSLVDGQSTMQYDKDENGNSHIVYTSTMDRNAFEIYGLNLIADYGASPKSVYINEMLYKEMELSETDREVKFQEMGEFPIAGVVGNFHQGNILSGYTPYMITVQDDIDIDEFVEFIIKTDGSADAKRKIRETVGKIITITDEDIEDGLDIDWMIRDIEAGIRDNFDKTEGILDIVLMFTTIAVLISILGFIGMSLFFIRQRRSEIAVRRIMGGSVSEVVVLMLTKFCAPLLASAAIAVPLAYWIMNRWLQGFSFRIPLSAWIFLATCVISILIAVLSVLWQTSSAVRRNPAESIKTE